MAVPRKSFAVRPVGADLDALEAENIDEVVLYDGDDEAGVMDFERSVRVERAQIESARLEISPILSGDNDQQTSIIGSFVVVGKSGATYVVDLIDLFSRERDCCSCPDFIHGRLGACKHIEAVRQRLFPPPEQQLQVGSKKRKGKRKRQTLLLEPAHQKLLRAGRGDGAGPVPTLHGPVLTVRSDTRLRLEIVGPNADALVDALGARVLDDGSVEVAREHVTRAGRFPLVEGARITHAAVVAAHVLDQRRARAARAVEIADAIEEKRLDVDVLSSPLFPYQREGVAHLVRAGRAVLADDMGLGKTVQTIAACEILRRRGEAKRILVICPASLKHQWAAEIARYAGAKAVVIVGSVAARREAFASDAPYIILNYELTWRDLSLLETLEADVLVLDEAQRARNFRTKTAATLKRIPSRFLFVLTGTPVENKLDDLYGILQLVDADVLGPLWQFNLAHVTRDFENGGRIKGYKNLTELRRTIAPLVLRRRKEEVLLQLPPLTQQSRYVPLSREQKEIEEHHRRIAARLSAQAKKRPLTPSEQKRLTAALMKARQACNAAVLCDPMTTDRTPAKIDELANLVSEIAQQPAGSNKVLVFSEWTEMLKLAAARLDAEDIGYLMLHGDVPTEKRPALLEQFRTDDRKVVLLSTDAGGLGLNLQVASYVVHLDLPWNPARLDQRTGRAYRLGQMRGVLVTYLCAESGIEREIEGTLQRKRAIRSAALDRRSKVDSLEAPSLGVFLQEVAEVLESDVKLASADAIDASAAALVVNGSASVAETPAPPRLLEQPAKPVKSSSQTADLRATEAFARQRLRLAHVVLDAGFYGDAVRAAYDALAASLRARLDAAIGESHAALVAAVYRDLLPSGAIPATLPALLGKIHDLTLLAEQGLTVDQQIATDAVEEARAWLECDDAFVIESPR